MMLKARLSLLIVSSLMVSSAIAMQNRAIQSLQSAAGEACTGNLDKKGCERVVWFTAKAVMINTSFYLQSCRVRKNISPENKIPCQEVEELLKKINSTR